VGQAVAVTTSRTDGKWNRRSTCWSKEGNTHDVAEHVEEAAEGVVGEALAALGGEAGGDLVVEPEVEHGVHHAWHGHGGAGADGEQERPLRVAEGGAHVLLHELQAVQDLGPQPRREDAPGVLVLLARLRRHREPRRHRQPDARHLRQVRALATQLIDDPPSISICMYVCM